MQYKIKKTGNSTTVTIPPFIVNQLDIKVGEFIKVDWNKRKRQVVFTIGKEEENV